MKNMSKKIDHSVQILGVRITGTKRSQVLIKIGLQRKNLWHLATVNPEFVMQARSNPRFAQTLEECQMTVADGWGIVWAARILGLPEVERVSGSDLVQWILAEANRKEQKLFLLGARTGVAEAAAKRISVKYPHVRVSWFEGARTVAVEGKDEASMTIAKINAFEPDYLLVAYGSPWQDMWIEENRPYLRAKVAIGVGGALDELAGIVPMCPKWLDELGLKWLFRLVTEPWRIKRQIGLLKFIGLVLSTYAKASVRQHKN